MSIRVLSRRFRALVAAAIVLVAVLPAAADEPGDVATPTLRLTDISGDLGVDFVSVSGDGEMDYIVEANGNGAALFDFDLDGDLDLLLVSGSTIERFEQQGGHRMLALYRNEGDFAFTERTSDSGLTATGWGMGACVADYDRDGWPDLYVTAFGPNLLFRNGGDGTFTEVAKSAGVADPGWSHSCAFGDFDHDGDPDLYVTNYAEFDRQVIGPRGPESPCKYRGFSTFCGPLGLEPQVDRLYRNDGEGHLLQVDTDAPARFAMGVAFSDLGGHGRADFFVSNDSQYNSLLRFQDGVAAEEALLAGLAVNELGMPQASMGIAVGDYDNDLDLDLLVTNFSEDYNSLYQNVGNGSFIDFSLPSGLAQSTMTDLSWGVLFVDLDNDGWLDVFVANGHVFEDAESFGFGSTYLQTNRVFRNLQDGRLQDVTGNVGTGLAPRHSSRGLAAGDLDGDGDLDLVIVNLNDSPTILRNDTQPSARYLRVKLLTGPGSDDPTGTRLLLYGTSEPRLVELTGGGSYLSHSESVAHFGLGTTDTVDRLEIRPLVGPRRDFLDPPAPATLVVAAGSSGSSRRRH